MTLSTLQGKYRGTVVSTSDPRASGRLKVQVSLGGQPVEVWADACVPYTGTSNAIYAIPPEGSGVWVEFAEGDVNKPIWTGCWWKEGELKGAISGVPLESLPVVIQSKAQHRVILAGSSGDAVIIETAQGEAGPRIVLKDGSVKISCGPTMSIEITDSEVKINDDGLVVT
jgi:Type VI secretion system/phage-baseplate injector OB domain